MVGYRTGVVVYVLAGDISGLGIQNVAQVPHPLSEAVQISMCVTSHGPMTPKRTVELSRMFTKDDVGLIYVSAFPDFPEFNKHVKKIAWDTEVWIV